MRTPIHPLWVVDLIPEVREELLHVLESLADDDWEKPTVCEGWSVRDVALHILGDDMGLLSNLRDHDGRYHKFEGWDELVNYINAQNALWVSAARRLSRRLLIDLLRYTGQQVYTHFLSIDPAALGGPIGWAGDQPDPMWLHIARELTEYWTHHQHICDAVGRNSLKEPRYMQPVLATFVHALPQTYQAVDAPMDTLVRFVIAGGGEWHLVREADQWRLYANTDLPPASTVSLDADTAWRLFTKNQDVETLRPRITITGDVHLGEAMLNTVSIIA